MAIVLNYIVFATSQTLPNYVGSRSLVGRTYSEVILPTIELCGLEIQNNNPIHKITANPEILSENSGLWALAMIGKLMRAKLDADGFNTRYGMNIYATYVGDINIDEDFDKFLIDMVIPDLGTVFAVAKAEFSTTPRIGAYHIMSISRNQPNNNTSTYRPLKVGQILNITGNGGDQYYLVEQVSKAGVTAVVCELENYNEDSGTYNRGKMTTIRRKTSMNEYYWSLFNGVEDRSKSIRKIIEASDGSKGDISKG